MAFSEMEQCQEVMPNAKERELCEWKALQLGYLYNVTRPAHIVE